eukprot:6084340-Pleurochrysis_carterae.AAC.1
MVGHTHQDIDASFRCVSDYWSRRGKCLTPFVFLTYLQSAIPGSIIRPLVEYVHDAAFTIRLMASPRRGSSS